LKLIPELVKNIDREIDRLKKELINLVQAVVRIKSVNPTCDCVDYNQELGGESAVNEYLKPILEELGFKTNFWAEEKDRYNLVGELIGFGEGKSLIFNGHVDVAPTGPVDQWIDKNPWSGKLLDNKIFGRGSSDMKGGNIAVLIGLKAIQNLGYQLKGDIIYESVVGEEMMNTDVGTGAVIKKGYRADSAIVPEPSAPPYKLSICPTSPGVLYLVCSIKGKMSHSSMRGEMIRDGGLGEKAGVNAIDKAEIIYNGLIELEKKWVKTKRHPLFKPGHFTIHPVIIKGGETGTSTPNQCILEYTIWYPPQDNKEDIKTEIENHIMGISREDDWLSKNLPKTEWVLWWPPYFIDKEAPICKTVANSYEAVFGEKIKYQGFPAVSDASFLNQAGIPTISIGPGDLTLAHAVNEFVEVNDLVKAAKVYALSSLEWCGYQEI
jgi:acetylornithine deacetylase/succinyl-diaminopimelate desuccinylase family protein